MMTIYIAGPLFSLAEKNFNKELAVNITEQISNSKIILPQDRAPKLIKLENGFRLVFEDCINMINESDAIVAILDGSDADSGTCIELGYAYSKNIPIIGIRTDLRASEEEGLNLMISNICHVLIRDIESDLQAISEKAVEALKKIQKGIQPIKLTL